MTASPSLVGDPATRLTELLGCDVPIVCAPMAGVAGGQLASAVSAAGAFGMIGMGASASPADIATHSAVAAATDRPFGIGLIAWALESNPAQIDAVIAAAPKMVSVSFGDYRSHVTTLQGAGILVATQVADIDGALEARDAGVDVIVARGAEAGGHGLDRMATIPLLEEVLERVAEVPVLAAGGVSTGRGLAAVLAAGAAGAWMGTAFLACPEASNTPAARARVLDATGNDTVFTSVFDIAQNIPWPASYAGRALRNVFTDSWHGREAELAADPDASERLAAAKATGDFDIAYIYAGQGVGSVRSVRSAAEVVTDVGGRASQLLGPGWVAPALRH